MLRKCARALTAILITYQYVTVMAHMQMQQPLALGSEGMQGYGTQTFDYFAVEPISADIPFPCHGQHLKMPAGVPRTAYTAGQEITVTLGNPAGLVTHDGGSCQFSLSYDGGVSFGVIHSVIGGCPIALDYSFQIPKEAPAGDTLLGWSGKREFYHSCAAVTIQSSSSSLTVPAMFIANNGDDCSTVDGNELVFPNPGISVAYGGKWAGQKPTSADVQAPGCSPSILEGSLVTLQSSGISSPPSAVPSGTVATTSVQYEQQADGETPLSTNVPAQTDAIPPPRNSVRVDEYAAVEDKPSRQSVGDCAGGIRCSPDGKGLSICDLSGWFPMESIAPGILCTEGVVVFTKTAAPSAPDSSTSCSVGSIQCSDDGSSFYLCHAGSPRYVPMGTVAASGAACQAGKITVKKAQRRRRRAQSAYATPTAPQP